MKSFGSVHNIYSHPVYTPRTLSVTDTEPERFLLLESHFVVPRDEDESQPSEPSTPSTSVSNLSDTPYGELAKGIILPPAGADGHKGDGGDGEILGERLIMTVSGHADSPIPKAERRISGPFRGQQAARARRQRVCPLREDSALLSIRARSLAGGIGLSLPPRGLPTAVRARHRCHGRSGHRVQKPTSTLLRSRPVGRRRLS